MARAIFTIAVAFLCIAAATTPFRDFSSLRTHFRAAYCMRLLYVNMGHVNNKFERETRRVVVSTDAEFPSVKVERWGKISWTENRTAKCLSERTRQFQPCPFCFRIFLPATRSRTARRNFSRSAGLSMSSLSFIASATVLA